ncbi:DoxX family protein [Hymenobacter volaticus]|uniref:DoxX family protein n=1 Tax=Hymenobacter volaticus TaxID=2932254 RepID=A0ABY4G5Y6_9BACT|nr:DoxX family protein [Hymenobacter volaticus]UOQ66325.1 DoxX family protein [Hymenobacter volaticus]
MSSLRRFSIYLLALIFIGAGILHFAAPSPYLRIMPPYLPAPLLLVYVSGAAEIAGGLGLLFPATRQVAGVGLVLLLVAVFPANVYMLQAHGAGLSVPMWALWLRLPLQLVLIAWVWWSSRARFQRAKVR